jgi:hypothetical protein
MALYGLNLFNEVPRNRKNSNPRKGIKYILKYSHSEPTLSVPLPLVGEINLQILKGPPRRVGRKW